MLDSGQLEKAEFRLPPEIALLRNQALFQSSKSRQESIWQKEVHFNIAILALHSEQPDIVSLFGCIKDSQGLGYKVGLRDHLLSAEILQKSLIQYSHNITSYALNMPNAFSIDFYYTSIPTFFPDKSFNSLT